LFEHERMKVKNIEKEDEKFISYPPISMKKE